MQTPLWPINNYIPSSKIITRALRFCVQSELVIANVLSNYFVSFPPDINNQSQFISI